MTPKVKKENLIRVSFLSRINFSVQLATSEFMGTKAHPKYYEQKSVAKSKYNSYLYLSKRIIDLIILFLSQYVQLKD